MVNICPRHDLEKSTFVCLQALRLVDLYTKKGYEPKSKRNYIKVIQTPPFLLFCAP